MLKRLLLAAALLWVAAGIAPPAEARSCVPVVCGGLVPAFNATFFNTLAPGFKITRLSSATTALYTDSATTAVTTFSTNAARTDPRGLFYEQPSVTNFLLNSGVPVTQTTGSLSTATYSFFCNGTGSVTSSAGTATATGLGAQACSSGTWQTIVVTVAGTLTFTKTGTVNWFDLQNYAVPTTHIVTAGATVARAAETLASTNVIPPAAYGMLFAKALMPTASIGGANYSFIGLTDGTSGVADVFNGAINTANEANVLYSISGSGGETGGVVLSYPTTISLGVKWTPTTFQGIINGVLKTTVTGLTFPADMTTLTVTGTYGSSTNANVFAGILQKITLYTGQPAQARFGSIGAAY